MFLSSLSLRIAELPNVLLDEGKGGGYIGRFPLGRGTSDVPQQDTEQAGIYADSGFDRLSRAPSCSTCIKSKLRCLRHQ